MTPPGGCPAIPAGRLLDEDPCTVRGVDVVVAVVDVSARPVACHWLATPGRDQRGTRSAAEPWIRGCAAAGQCPVLVLPESCRTNSGQKHRQPLPCLSQPFHPLCHQPNTSRAERIPVRNTDKPLPWPGQPFHLLCHQPNVSGGWCGCFQLTRCAVLDSKRTCITCT